VDYISEVNINEAIIHVLDNNADEPILNEQRLTLNEEVYTFLLKHIQRCLKDEELKYAKFKEERNIIKELSQEYLSAQGNFIEVSKEIDPRKYLGAGREAIEGLVQNKIKNVLGSSNSL